MKALKQTFSDKTLVGASYGNGSEVSVAFAKPMELGAIEERPEVSQLTSSLKLMRREVLASPAVIEM